MNKMLLTTINIHWPIWGLILCLICSVGIIVSLVYCSIRMFKRYNLQIQNKRTNNGTDFIIKDTWFSEALHLLWFLFPIFLSMAIIIFNILVLIASLGG